MRWGYYANAHLMHLWKERDTRLDGVLPPDAPPQPWDRNRVPPFRLPPRPYNDHVASPEALRNLQPDASPPRARASMFGDPDVCARAFEDTLAKRRTPAEPRRGLSLGFRRGSGGGRGGGRSALRAPPNPEHFTPGLDFLRNTNDSAELGSCDQLRFPQREDEVDRLCAEAQRRGNFLALEHWGAFLHECNKVHPLKSRALSIDWRKSAWVKEVKQEQHQELLAHTKATREAREREEVVLTSASGQGTAPQDATSNTLPDGDLQMGEPEPD